MTSLIEWRCEVIFILEITMGELDIHEYYFMFINFIRLCLSFIVMTCLSMRYYSHFTMILLAVEP